MTILLKTSLFFSFLFTITLSNAQNSSSNDLEGGYLPILLSVETTQNQPTKDLEGRAEADEDWAKGEARYYWSINRMNNYVEYGLYFEHLGIYLDYFECLRPPNMEGYNRRIEEKLKEKSGRDIFKTIKKDRRVFYDSLNRLKTRNAIFIRGEKRFKAFINDQSHYIQDYEKGIEFPKNLNIQLTITINKKGKCKHLSLTQTEDALFNDKVFLWFQRSLKHCRWLPAKQSGKRIAEKRAFDIVFNPDRANN